MIKEIYKNSQKIFFDIAFYFEAIYFIQLNVIKDNKSLYK